MWLKSVFFSILYILSNYIYCQEIDSPNVVDIEDTLWIVNDNEKKVKHVTKNQILGVGAGDPYFFKKGRFIKFENDTIYLDPFMARKDTICISSNKIKMVHPLFNARIGAALKPPAVIIGTVGAMVCFVEGYVYPLFSISVPHNIIFGASGIAFTGLQQAGFWLRHKRYYMKHGWILK